MIILLFLICAITFYCTRSRMKFKYWDVRLHSPGGLDLPALVLLQKLRAKVTFLLSYRWPYATAISRTTTSY